MAPSRRKGKASSAAAAAAARRQWKVGDLVLAKVKGFPAWPATVSEPEKWGYSADWKKVLVYFFGTNQIAFCSPADVEAFTEEKKEYLLVKRQGKGADFVRAVQEIIDSYDKSKKQDRVDDFNSGGEVVVTNAGNSVDTLASSGLKDQTEASSGTLISQLNNSNSTGDRDEPSLIAEDAAAAAAATQLDVLHDRETLSEEPTDNVVVTETPLATTYSSRKRFGGIQPQSRVTQRRVPSVRRSRSSSRVDSCRFQNFIVPCNDGGKGAGDVASNVMRDGSLRRNKRIRKSPDASEWCDEGSPAFVSNGSIEDNGSEIVTVDSDTLSFNEGSTLDSGCYLEHPETVECLEGEVELRKRLDLQIKAVIIKKKRKPNRKRVTNDAAGLTNGLDKVASLEVGVHKTRQNSPNACEKSNEGYSKEDGDEHLPLVKRARVRMGKQLAVGEELDSFIRMEEKSSMEVSINLVGQVCTSLNCDEDGSPADRNSFVVKGAVENSSPLNNCIQFPENGPQFLKFKKNLSFGSVDGESALPPSKRLHRALEAMSANAAEDGQACAELPSNRNSLIDGRGVSSIRGCPHMFAESKSGNGLDLQNVDSLGNNASEDFMCGFCASLNPLISEEAKRSSVDLDICNQPVGSSKSKKAELETAETVVQTQSPEPLLSNLDARQASPRTNQRSLDQLSPKDEGKSENFELSNSRAGNLSKEVDTSEHTGISTDPISGADKIAEVSPQHGVEGNFCGSTKFLKPCRDDSSQVNGVCELVKEAKHKSSQTSSKVIIDAVQGTQHLALSASISDDHLGEKDVSGIRSSPSPADGVDFPARASPPNTSLCSLTATANSHFLQNNGCCSPDIHLHPVKTVCSLDVEEGKLDSVLTYDGKWSNRVEANAALSFFEAMLGTLTRTKESIGRATRIAIDCAKFGIAAKVVEILVRHLESESSLHRRVDLFFLVDSITQCSQGLKGDVGGIYPSAIQAVLPRLVSAAAPPRSTAQENRRQCLKVLRLWLERRILPESIIRHHMRQLDSITGSFSTGAFSRRPSRTERAFDDPLREMEGMLVDEYGSNSSFQLPGFCMPRMLKDEDEGSDSDGGSFEAVTPEHNSRTPEERELTPKVEKHRHILEDVDGELEMEDVAPSCEVEMSSTSNVNGVNTEQTSQLEPHFPLSFAPPLPNDVPPSSPPLPTSPPPPPPPPPPPLPPAASMMSYPLTNGVDSKLYVGTHNMQDNLQQSMAQQLVAPRIKPTITDPSHYHGPERREFEMQMPIPDSTGNCSFGNFPVSHHLIRPVNNVQTTDGAALNNNNSYHLRPPHPAPSNQFSYVQADQRVPSRRDAPPSSYSNRYHFARNMESGNFNNDHDRMKLSIHELGENWRFSGPPFPGPLHPDKARASFAPAPYVGQPCDPTRTPNQGWALPSHAMNHRNSVPIRPPSEGAVPVGIRAPSFWRPR